MLWIFAFLLVRLASRGKGGAVGKAFIMLLGCLITGFALAEVFCSSRSTCFLIVSYLSVVVVLVMCLTTLNFETQDGDLLYRWAVLGVLLIFIGVCEWRGVAEWFHSNLNENPYFKSGVKLLIFLFVALLLIAGGCKPTEGETPFSELTGPDTPFGNPKFKS